eukprot:7385552-Prymnesium_polylepis.1
MAPVKAARKNAEALASIRRETGNCRSATTTTPSHSSPAWNKVMAARARSCCLSGSEIVSVASPLAAAASARARLRGGMARSVGGAHESTASAGARKALGQFW